MRLNSVWKALFLLPMALPVVTSAEKTVPDLVKDLGAEDFETREQAQTTLRAMGEGILPQLLQAKEQLKDPEPISRIDQLVLWKIRPRVDQFVSNLRGTAPWATDHMLKGLSLYEALPASGKKIFRDEAKDFFDVTLPEELRSLPNVRARTGKIAPVQSRVLFLRADGSGTYECTWDLKTWGELLMQIRAGENAEEPAEEEITKKELRDFLKEILPMLKPKPCKGVKFVRETEKPLEAGQLHMELAFTDLEALTNSLTGSEETYAFGFSLQGSPTQALLRRSLKHKEHAMLGLELYLIDGVRERFVLKSDRPIRNSTGKRISATEVHWDASAYDLMEGPVVSAEFSNEESSRTAIPEWKTASRFESKRDPNTGQLVDTPIPLNEYYLRLLFDTDQAERLYAAYLISEEPDRYSQDSIKAQFPDRRKVVGPALLKAMKMETEFRNIVWQHFALCSWYSKDIPYWDIGEWEAIIKADAAAAPPSR